MGGTGKNLAGTLAAQNFCRGANRACRIDHVVQDNGDLVLGSTRGDGEIGEDHTPETHLIPLILDAAAGRRPRDPTS